MLHTGSLSNNFFFALSINRFIKSMSTSSFVQTSVNQKKKLLWLRSLRENIFCKESQHKENILTKMNRKTKYCGKTYLSQRTVKRIPFNSLRIEQSQTIQYNTQKIVEHNEENSYLRFMFRLCNTKNREKSFSIFCK